MARLLQALDRLLPDPPPPLVFEIGWNSMQGALREGDQVLKHADHPWPAPLHAADTEPGADTLAGALDELLRELGPAPSPCAAVLLPDADTRLAVFEFDKPPRRAKDLRNAVAERFRQGLPFDAQDARIACQAQPGSQPVPVLAAAASAPAVLRCEEACEIVGLVPDYVGLATAAALNLVSDPEMTLVIKASGRTLTMAAVAGGAARLVRQIALPDDFGRDIRSALREVLADLFPTLVYVEENLGSPVSRLLACGFEGSLETALEILPRETGCRVEPLTPNGQPGGAGLRGYIHG